MIQPIRRRILQALEAHLLAPEMTLLIGPRQVGKTTLIQMLLRGVEAKGHRTVFFNLDIEEDMHWFDSQRRFLDRLEFLVGKTGKLVYVAIDEIQRKNDAGRFMKGLYDMGLPYKFILSGSGSLELKEQIAESMMGRNLPPVVLCPSPVRRSLRSLLHRSMPYVTVIGLNEIPPNLAVRSFASIQAAAA